MKLLLYLNYWMPAFSKSERMDPCYATRLFSLGRCHTYVFGKSVRAKISIFILFKELRKWNFNLSDFRDALGKILLFSAKLITLVTNQSHDVPHIILRLPYKPISINFKFNEKYNNIELKKVYCGKILNVLTKLSSVETQNLTKSCVMQGGFLLKCVCYLLPVLRW